MTKQWDDLDESVKVSILNEIKYPTHRIRGVVKMKFSQFHEELKTKITKQLSKESED